MNEQLTQVPEEEEESQEAAESGRRLSRHDLGVGAGIALAVIAGVATWVISGRTGPSDHPHVTPTAPVALSASAVKTLAQAVGQPIYWAGPRRKFLYELNRSAEGIVSIRYLPPGVSVGAPGGKYMIITTYPFPGALDALKGIAGDRGIEVPGGGLALVDQQHPTSVRLAFPNVPYQVGVYDPSPAQALAVVTSGQVQPAR